MQAKKDLETQKKSLCCLCLYEKLKQLKVEWVASIFWAVCLTDPWARAWISHVITYDDTSKHSYPSTKYDIRWFQKEFTPPNIYKNFVIVFIWTIYAFLRELFLISHSFVPPPNRTTSSHVNNMTVINPKRPLPPHPLSWSRIGHQIFMRWSFLLSYPLSFSLPLFLSVGGPSLCCTYNMHHTLTTQTRAPKYRILDTTAPTKATACPTVFILSE